MAIVPRGFRDILPDEAEMREHVAATVRDRLKQHGYRPIETPLIESSTVGVDGARPSDTPFKLFDDNGDLLIVKPDNTTAVVRAIATRMSERDLPLRLRYEAPVVRQQPRGTARRRQFTQLGYELVGEGGDAADAEMVLMADEALAALGLDSWQLLCSSVAPYQALLELGVDAQLATEALGLVHANDYIDLDALIADSDLPAPLKRAMCELPRITGDAKALDRVDALLRDAGATHSTTTELRSLVQRLAMRASTICSRLSFDFSLMNSFGYYTGFVLKAYAGDLADPVGSGGRYDAVLDTALEQGAAAAGFAFSLERLTEALEAQAERVEPAADKVDGATASAPLRIAVPKGSLKDDTIAMLNAVGIDADGLRDPGRHLIVPTRDARGGADGIAAGAGDDFVEITANTFDAGVANGGAGSDTLSFGAANDKITFSYDDGNLTIASKVGKTVDTLSGISGFEAYTGGAGNDTLDAASVTGGISLTLTGGLGNDLLTGGSGDDLLIADGGNDTLDLTQGGVDGIKLQAGSDLNYTKKGTTTITVKGYGPDDLVNDSELTSAGWAKVEDNSSKETTFTYTRGSQTINVVFEGITDPNSITFAQQRTLSGGAANAADSSSGMPLFITATGGNNTVSGGTNNDTITSTGGDTIYGNGGNDSITLDNSTLTTASGTATSVSGGAGDDTVVLHLLNGSVSSDMALDGAAGTDLLEVKGSGASVAANFTFEAGADSVTLYQSGTSIAAATISDFERFIATDNADTVNFNREIAAGESYSFALEGGNDSISISIGGGSLTGGLSIDGGKGTDTLELASDFTGSVALGTNITNIEVVDASAVTGDLTLTGNATAATTFKLGAVSDARSLTVTGGEGADTFTLGKVDTSGAVSLTGGAGDNTYNVDKTGHDLSITGGDDADTVKLFGFDATTAEITDIYVRTTNSGKTLEIAGFDTVLTGAPADNTSVLTFTQASDFESSDVLQLCDASNALLGGSVNLSTIAGLDSNADTTWQKVKFTINASDGTTTVATVTP